MVWCLLVVPNYCMVDLLAKVNKTSEATQIPLCSTHIQTCRHMDIGNILTLVLSYLFWSFKEETLEVDLIFFTTSTSWWIKNEVMPLSFFKPNVCLRALWTCCGRYEIVFLKSKYSVSKSLLFVFWWLRLLLILLTYWDVLCVYVHFFYLPQSTITGLPAKRFVFKMVRPHTNTGTKINSLTAWKQDPLDVP